MSEHHTQHDPSFEEVRADIEARQKNILFEDTARNGRFEDPFGWKTTPKPRGLIAFVILFAVLAAGLFTTAFFIGLEEEGLVALLIGTGALVLSILLLRRVFLRR